MPLSTIPYALIAFRLLAGIAAPVLALTLGLPSRYAIASSWPSASCPTSSTG
jgi:hypothetical protein